MGMPGALGECLMTAPLEPRWRRRGLSLSSAAHSRHRAVRFVLPVLSNTMSSLAARQAPCTRRAAVGLAAQGAAASPSLRSLSTMVSHVTYNRHHRPSCCRRAASAAPHVRRRRFAAPPPLAAQQRQRSRALPRQPADERCCSVQGCCWLAAPPARPAAMRRRQLIAAQQPAAAASLCSSPTQHKATLCCGPPAGNRWAWLLPACCGTSSCCCFAGLAGYSVFWGGKALRHIGEWALGGPC